MDELSPLFQEIEFHERFRGYDPDEVDAYVDRVAKAAALVSGRLSELHERVDAAEARSSRVHHGEAEETLTRTLVLAQRTADAAVAEAREEADRMTTDAATSAQAILSAAQAEAQLTLREAQAEASAALKDSEDRAALVLEEAEADRRVLVAEAESGAAAAADAERERLAMEVAELQQYRAFLADDIEILERHLTEERHQLTVSLSSLTDLLEAPHAFRSGRVPQTSGVEVDEALLETQFDGSDLLTAPDPSAPVTEGIADEAADVAPIGSDESAFDGATAEEAVPVVAEEAVPVVDEEEEVPAQVEAETAVAETIDLVAAEYAEGHAAPIFQPIEPAEASQLDVDAVQIDLERHEVYAGAHELSADAAVLDLPPGDISNPPLLVTAADLDSTQMTGSRIGVDPGPVTAPHRMIDDAALFADPIHIADDPFLAQLRDAVVSEPMPETDDEALSAFFDHEEDDASRSWFGRRR